MNEQLSFSCTHRWNVDCDNKGVCKYCGEEKDFTQDNRKVFPDGKKYRYNLVSLFAPDYPVQGSLPSEYASLEVIREACY